MLISQIQLDRKKEELIQQSLKNGVIPTSYEVGSRSSEFFNSRTPGLPYYRPVKQTTFGTSNPITYNQMFSNLKEDLEIAYVANIRNSHQNTEMEENYLIEKDKVQTKIEALQLRLKALENAIHQTDTVYNHSTTFEHFYNIELDGELERNLPKTDCFIDLEQKSVYLDRMSSLIDKRDLTQSSLTVKGVGDYVYIDTLGEPRNILKDSLNESCTFIAYSKVNQPLTISLEVSTGKELVCSSVQLKLFSQCDSQAELILHGVDQKDETIYTTSHHDHFEWSFNSQSILGMTINVTKSEADGLNEDGLYEYVYTFKNLSSTNESFSTKGVFVSKPITLDHAVGSVELQVDEMVFKDTDISYFIGIDNGSNQINWERVKPGIETELGIVENITTFLEKDNENMGESRQQRQAFVRIHDLPEDCLTNTLKITPIVNGWDLTCYDYSEYSDGNPEREPMNLDTLNINEIENLPGIMFYKDFVSATKRTINAYSNTLNILTQYVEMEEEAYIQNAQFGMNENEPMEVNEGKELFEQYIGGELQVRMFVNGVEVRPVEGRFNFKLRAGRNKIQIMFLKDDVGIDYNYLEIMNSLDLTNVGKSVYGLNPLKQIDYQTMIDKVSRYDELVDDYYTIVDNSIYTIYDIRDDVLSEDDITPYKMEYQRVKANAKHLLSYKNNQYQMTVRLMAVLKSQNKSYSPRLMSYRIMAK